jgi:hypothetical protein
VLGDVLGDVFGTCVEVLLNDGREVLVSARRRAKKRGKEVLETRRRARRSTTVVCDVLEATYLGDVLGDVLGEVLGDDRRAWYFERCSAEEKYMYCMVGTVLLSCCTRTYLCTQYPTVLLYLWPTTCVR